MKENDWAAMMVDSKVETRVLTMESSSVTHLVAKKA
jgi:hypothetical protein